MSPAPHHPHFRAVIVMALAASLSSCDGQSPPPVAPPAPLPAELCRNAKAGLDKLADAAGLVFTVSGEMTIERQVWFAFPEQQREQVTRILGTHASCVAGGKVRDTEVTIRDVSGTVLLRQLQRTTPDMKDILGSDEAH